MTTKHTPGPWTRKRAIPDDDTISRLVFAGDDLIATVHDLEDAGHEAFANARLIAAAPELLAALVALQTTRPRDNFGRISYKAAYEAMLRQARAAIATATGGPEHDPR